MSDSILEKLQQAHGRFNARDLGGAERLCNDILSGAPGHPDALHLLGVVRLVSGNAAAAVKLLGRALESRPHDAAILESLGMARMTHGDANGAEAALRQAIAKGANSGITHMRLGMVLGALGRLDEAESVMRVAATRLPHDANVHVNLGNVLAGLGRGDEALDSFRRALALQPGNLDAQYNIGTLLKDLGRLEEALAAFGAVLAADPGNADTLVNLGIVQEKLGRLDEAIAGYRKALAREPGHVHALINLGSALRSQGKLDEAAASCEKALAIQPDFADAAVNLGAVRAEQGRYRESQALFERALRADPGSADAYRNLGALFKAEGRVGDAVVNYRKAAERTPGQPAVQVDLGNVLRDSGDFPGALTAYRKAIEIDARHAPAHYNLAETLKVMGRLDASVEAYERTLAVRPDDMQALGGLIHVRQHLCDWNGLEALWDRLRRRIADQRGAGVSPFSTLSMPTTAAEQLACATGWAQAHVEPAAVARPLLDSEAVQRPAHEGGKRRIGYLSWGFHNHATAYWAAELLELHDRGRYEIHGYDYGPDDNSAIRARVVSACDRFTSLAGESHLAAARRIRADGIDVLVDLTGYTLGARPQILALRPAPVQVSWFYPGTMGTRCIDYFIADPYALPSELEHAFSEKIVRLPDCYMPADRRREASEASPSREACGLPTEGVVFCCFNQAYKILPETFSLWMRVLRAVPGSVLWLAEANRWSVENLKREAAARGVDAQRLVFADRKPAAEYMAQYRLADLALDTFPYTSHTTAADALWMGCPLVTRMGETFASRVAGSVLINAGLRELVASTDEECERKLIELATVPDKLQDVRRRLAESRDTCPLFDTRRFVRNLEQTYDTMLAGRGHAA